MIKKEKKSNRHSPPQAARKFLLWFLKKEMVEEVLGDLDEQFQATLRQGSLAKARRNYWYQVFNYFRPFAIRNIRTNPSNFPGMYRNYFKIGYRNLLRNKIYSSINIGGLAVGMAVVMLIGLWIYDELSYNRYHENYDRIAQVMQHQTINGRKGTQSSIPFPMGDEMRDKHGSDFKYVVMSSWHGAHILSFGNKKISRTGGYMEDEAPRMLSLKMLDGSLDGLEDPGSILLAASTAKALFDEADPIGQLMQIDNKLGVIVRGIYEDLPPNTQFKGLKFIAPWELYISSEDWLKKARKDQHWDQNSFQCFAQIADHADMQQVSEGIKNIKYNNLNDSQKTLNSEVFLHPMKDWRLRDNWENGVKKGGFIEYVRMFGIIGLFILILACINFMNLSTAQSQKRAKEVGVRKSLGSLRGQLINQFLSESFLMVGLAFGLAIILVYLAIPSFNYLAGKQIVFPLEDRSLWLISLAFIIITGFVAGSYPAFYLSSFHPIKVLKGTFKAGRSGATFRRVLVVIQFTASMILIIGTMVVEKQIQYTRNRPMGYDNGGTVMIGINTPDFEGKYELLRSELKKQSAIVEMAESSSPMTALWSFNDGFEWEGKDPEFQPLLGTIWVTHDFGRTIGWNILEGRDFSREFATDSTALIINEAAVKYLGLDNPVGKKISWNGKDHHIIGVVQDILRESPFESVRQVVYLIDYDNVNWILLKLNPDKSTAAALALVKDVFNTHLPAVPFEYSFVDQQFARKFSKVERISRLSGVFALFAIFISCLGLFGLASFMAAQRIKEIGIRKVMGASVFNLWQLLSKNFVALVLLSCFLAIPISYYVVVNWLENYEYRTEISWWIFVLASLGALVITLLTVSFQAIKAATMNPVKSLRSE